MSVFFVSRCKNIFHWLSFSFKNYISYNGKESSFGTLKRRVFTADSNHSSASLISVSTSSILKLHIFSANKLAKPCRYIPVCKYNLTASSSLKLNVSLNASYILIVTKQRRCCMQHSIEKTIKELRKSRGLTQEELAEKIGITAQAISKW